MHGATPEPEAVIAADDVTRIEISRDKVEDRVQVRIFLGDLTEPRVFDFPDMEAAVAFYKDLWARRTAPGAENVVSITA